jgi:hypothetical protein
MRFSSTIQPSTCNKEPSPSCPPSPSRVRSFEYHPRRLTRLRRLWDGFRLIKKCTCSKLSDGSGYPRCKQTNKSGLLDKYANQSRPRCTANLRIRPKPSLFTSGPPHLCWAQTRSPLRPRVLASPFRQELFVIMRAPTRAIARLPLRTLQ